ncbi:MAG: 5-oxoprolinase subunit C family protein [Fimbriimonadaceae bacterium]
MSLRVERLYGHASIQGAPAWGRRRFGVPPGGCFDPLLQERLNAVLGNALNAPVLELALCHISLLVTDDLVLAWSGCAGVSINGVAMDSFQAAHPIRASSVVTFDVPRIGVRHWVAVGGGFTGASHMVHRGEALSIGEGRPGPTAALADSRAEANSSVVLRALPGLPGFAQVFQNQYTVSHDSNRVGIRLDGPTMAHGLELPSEPATPGVIQITPEGRPIVLGPDGPTIGGYPRAGVVISADVPALAQLRPGSDVRFVRVSLDSAAAAAAQTASVQQQFLSNLGP